MEHKIRQRVAALQLSKVKSTEPTFRCRQIQFQSRTKNAQTSVKDVLLPPNMRIRKRSVISRIKDIALAIIQILNPIRRRSYELTGLRSNSVVRTGYYVIHILRERTYRSVTQVILKEGNVTKAFKITVLVYYTRFNVFNLAVHTLRR